jgi:hypothetical protein
MLTISLCRDTRRVAAACKRFGMIYSEAFYLYAAEGRDGTLAETLFEVKSAGVEAAGYHDYQNSGGDPGLFDGLLRAGLNYAQTQGMEQGCIPEEFRREHGDLFAKLNYPAQSLFDITNFFSKYKNCAL